MDSAPVKTHPLTECLERRTDVQSGPTGEVTALKTLQWDLIQTSLGSLPTWSLVTQEQSRKCNHWTVTGDPEGLYGFI